MARNVRRKVVHVEPGARRGRMLLIAVLFAAGLMALLSRAWYLQVHRNEHYVSLARGNHAQRITVRARRGTIYDRKGQPLAVSRMVPSIYCVPRKIKDPAAIATQLAPLLGQPRSLLERRLTGTRSFAWLARYVTAEARDKVMALGLAGIAVRPESKRFYPNKSLAGPILGFVGTDGKGLEGIERDMNDVLEGKTYVVDALRDATGRSSLVEGALSAEHLVGHDVYLTIDSRIQHVAETSLYHQVREMNAEGGMVVVLDPRTGDLLAMAQTPPFDPNTFRKRDPGDWRNRIITDVLEPGSTVKPLLVAAAIDAGKIRAQTIWSNKGVKIGRKTFRDHHPHPDMTSLDIIKFSSNVGAIQVALRLGKESYYSYLRAFGFGEPSGLPMRGEQSGALTPARHWRQIKLATLSFGYGLNVTAIQLARATGVIANGGVLMAPRLVKQVRDGAGRLVRAYAPRIERLVLSERAAKAATRGMVKVVHEKGGTAPRARIPGFIVAGKTGTAHKLSASRRKGYDDDRVRASFVGFVPAQNPRLLVFVTINEPKEEHYGGAVSAPVFQNIATAVLPFLGVKATEPFTAEDYGEDIEDVADRIDPKSRPWWFVEGDLVGAPARMVVPDMHGRPLKEVVGTAAEKNMRLLVEGSGLVVSQHPQAGSLLPPDGVLAVKLAAPGRLRGGTR